MSARSQDCVCRRAAHFGKALANASKWRRDRCGYNHVFESRSHNRRAATIYKVCKPSCSDIT